MKPVPGVQNVEDLWSRLLNQIRTRRQPSSSFHTWKILSPLSSDAWTMWHCRACFFQNLLSTHHPWSKESFPSVWALTLHRIHSKPFLPSCGEIEASKQAHCDPKSEPHFEMRQSLLELGGDHPLFRAKAFME